MAGPWRDVPLVLGYHRVVDDFARNAARTMPAMLISARMLERQLDWVARHAEDSIAVVLPRTTGGAALGLAERTRAMIEERLAFRDHRNDKRVRVTVSAAVVSVQSDESAPIDTSRIIAEAEAALGRAKRRGRNQVERVDIAPESMSVTQAARALRLTPARVRKLAAAGTLTALRSGRTLRFPRAAVEMLKKAAAS
jgi:diguanylate cyclase (GGDEF)-like protein/excisionase family DNA binding protein